MVRCACTKIYNNKNFDLDSKSTLIALGFHLISRANDVFWNHGEPLTSYTCIANILNFLCMPDVDVELIMHVANRI